MPQYKIFYMKPEHYSRFIFGDSVPVEAELEKTHIELKTIEAHSRADVFHKMQGEVWSPNGEARALIEAKGLKHTSMSVGDVLQELGHNYYYACARTGWVRLK